MDDMLIAAKDMSIIQKLKAELSTAFDMKDLGPTKKILGLEIICDRQSGRFFLTQHSILKKS